MARPAQPIAVADPLVIVDGRTPFVGRSLPFVDDAGRPLDRRTVRLELVATRDDRATAIHPALSGPGVSVGEGGYTLALMPRDLWLRLAPFANERVWLRAQLPGAITQYIPLRVVWRADTYPLPESAV